MMNMAQAMAYGKKIGCKYYVYNSNDGLMGGFTTREAAEDYLQRCVEEYKDNPWSSDLTFHIETK